MATRKDDTDNASLLAALGGTVNATDDVIVRNYARRYTTSDLSASDINSLMLGRDFKGAFSAASGGSQLKVVVNNAGAGILTDASSASAVEIISTGPTGVVKEVRYQAANGHPMSVDAMDCDTLYATGAGSVAIGGTCDLATLHALGPNVSMIETATYPLTTVYCTAGSVGLMRDLTTLHVMGTGVVTAKSTNVTPGTVNMKGGRYNMVLCGNHGTLQGEAGEIDQTSLAESITITTSALGPGVTIYRSRKTVAPTVTNNNDYAGGPRIVYVD